MQDIEELHNAACEREEPTYIDPKTGYCVFTAFHLLTRGKCCGCGCRHCPYKVGSEFHDEPSQVLNGDLDDVGADVDLMFFSGGKDSYLAMRRLIREGVRDIFLVTTYESATGLVAHQGVGIEDVKRQAKILGMVLIGVPLRFGGYVRGVARTVERLRDHGIEVRRLVFGDLHLRHIREWRERMLGQLCELYFPLWGVEYNVLLDELKEEEVVVRVSAAERVRGVKIGDFFNREFVEALPREVDKFGERGEFHTLVCLWEQPDRKHQSVRFIN